jgi:hypothetical protein
VTLWHDVSMGTNPTQRESVELDEETRRILDERVRTFDGDVKDARPADEVMAELRARLQRKDAVPRP